MYGVCVRTKIDVKCGAGKRTEPRSNIDGGPQRLGRVSAHIGGHKHVAACHRIGHHAKVATTLALEAHSQDVLRLYHVLLQLLYGNAVADERR